MADSKPPKVLEELFRAYTLSMGSLMTTVTSLKDCQCKHDCERLGDPKFQEEVQVDLIRGGVVRAWVNWEAFLGNIIREVFRIVIGENDSTITVEADRAQLKDLVEKWSHIRTLIEKQLERRGKAAVAAAAFDLLVGEDNWRTLLCRFLDEAVDAMSPIFAPGGNNRGINDTFKELFRLKGKEFPLVSNNIVNLKDNVFQFEYHVETGEPPFDVVIKKEDSLHYMLCLYYGLRCALTHGSADKTFKRGALTDFSKKVSSIELIVKQREVCESAVVQDSCSRMVQKSLAELYAKIEKYTKEAVVTLCDLETMVSFLKQCAKHLTIIMTNWLEELKATKPDC